MQRRKFLRAATAGVVVVGSAWTAGGLASGMSGGIAADRAHPDPHGAEPPAGFRWSLYFEDEFDSINTDLWFRYDNRYGSDIGTVDRLRPENITADGTLNIRTSREAYQGADFTSGFLSTGRRGEQGSPEPPADTFFPRAGHYECRARYTHGQGLTQAFWLRHRAGASVADISITETFHAQHPGRTHQVLNLDGTKNTYRVTPRVEDPERAPQWHTYGLSIVPEAGTVRCRFYVDGKQTGSHLAADSSFWRDHADELLWDISLNTHTGMAYAGHPDDDPLGRLHRIDPPRCSIGYTTADYPGSCAVVSPDGYPIVPWYQDMGDANFEIDYVRVWSLVPRR